MDGPDQQPSELVAALDVLRAERPELRGVPAVRLGAGLDHDAYRVGELVVRLRRDGDDDLGREAELLRRVARRCPVPTPLPVAGDAAWMAYPLLAGTALLGCLPEFRAIHAGALAATLGAALAALWGTPVEDVADLVEDDATPLEEWRDEAARNAGALEDELPSAARSEIERFLATEPPPSAARRVFSHNDLGAEHVLVDPRSGLVTGIIDWSDAAIADPARDLGLVLRDLGPAAHDVALGAAAAASRATPGDLAARALFHARCAALEDLVYGLESAEPAYANAARSAVATLFGGTMPAR